MIGILFLTFLTFLFGIILVNIDFELNKKDKKTEEIRRFLPGYNCGGCGFASCDEMACKILENVLNYQKCRPLKGEAREALENHLEELHLLKKD